MRQGSKRKQNEITTAATIGQTDDSRMSLVGDQ